MESKELENKELIIEPYSEKAFVVRGNTKAHKEELKKLKGKYNPYLNGGSGYIFSNKHLKEVEEYIKSLESGEKYQEVTYRVPLLSAGMKLELEKKGEITPVTITKIKTNDQGIVDNAYIETEDGKKYILKIINGEWGVCNNNYKVLL